MAFPLSPLHLLGLITGITYLSLHASVLHLGFVSESPVEFSKWCLGRRAFYSVVFRSGVGEQGWMLSNLFVNRTSSNAQPN